MSKETVKNSSNDIGMDFEMQRREGFVVWYFESITNNNCKKWKLILKQNENSFPILKGIR